MTALVAPQGAQLRVLVYNIHAGKDAQAADNLQRVAELIREARADLVLLQEVDRGTERSGRIDQPAVLTRLTGYHAAFGKTLDYQGGEYGIAVLSRWPIMADTLVPLPVQPRQQRAGGSYEPRGLLHATVAAPGRVIHALNTHLDPSPDDRYRIQEVAAVLRYAHRLAPESALVVLGGDFNALPLSRVRKRVAAEQWRDAWNTCGRGGGATFPASAPVIRIDYLFIRATLRCDSAQVIESVASDHRPVLFVLSAP